jgi:hypothetical protein
MKIRIAVAVLGILSLCSVISAKDNQQIAFGGGGLPTPCTPPSYTSTCPFQPSFQK